MDRLRAKSGLTDLRSFVVTIVKGDEVSELDKRSHRAELGSLPFVCWESRDPQLWALCSFLFDLGGADLGRPLTLTRPDLELLMPKTAPVRPRSRLLSRPRSSQSEKDQPSLLLRPEFLLLTSFELSRNWSILLKTLSNSCGFNPLSKRSRSSSLGSSPLLFLQSIISESSRISMGSFLSLLSSMVADLSSSLSESSLQ